MEKKNMQRIVGVLVIVALVIIVMPFLFGKNDFPAPQAENSKDATTPAQPTDMAANTDSADASLGQNGTTDSSSSNPVEITPNSPQHLSDATNANNQMSPDALPGDTNTTPADSLNSKPTASATNSSMTSTSNAPAASTTHNAKTTALPVPEALSSTVKPAKTAANAAPAGTLLPNTAVNSETKAVVKPVADVKKAETALSSNASTDSDAIVIDKDGSATVTHATTAPAPHKKHVHTISSHAPIKAKSVKAKMAKANLSKKHLAKNSKSPAWVIQMGSFNNKNNATRLMAKLRAAGFKVFAHEFKSASGKVSTRVYVGPEVKEASATKLSASVHQKVNMQGIVVLFKPVV